MKTRRRMTQILFNYIEFYNMIFMGILTIVKDVLFISVFIVILSGSEIEDSKAIPTTIWIWRTIEIIFSQYFYLLLQK